MPLSAANPAYSASVRGPETLHDLSLAYSSLASPVGEITVVAGERGLLRVHLGRPGTLNLGTDLERSPRHHHVAEAIDQLDEYFAGTRRTFDLRLDLRGTEFQVSAWRALARVPYGRTASYADQARRIGNPRAVRAVGSANGRNPVAVVLPCHRIISSDGSLGGYTGGLKVKKWLLEHEQLVAGRTAR